MSDPHPPVHGAPIRLRTLRADDLPFVLELEYRPDNQSFIGQWTREEHLASMARGDRRHLLIERVDATPLGYLIAYDVRAEGYGVYVKRIAVHERSRGTGRAALAAFAEAVRREGADSICLAVRTYNERAQRCYRAVGFVQWVLDDEARQQFLTRVDDFAAECLLMRLDLAANGS